MKRIKHLSATQKPTIVEHHQCPILTPDLEDRIFDDIRNGRLLTYQQAASQLGCSTEKMRLDAKGYPILKNGREHQIPECVFRLIVCSKLTAA